MTAKPKKVPHPNLGKRNGGRKRSRIEREQDLLYVQGLMRAEPEMQIQQITNLLNERRAATAREIALRRGDTEEEAEAIAKAAQISNQQVHIDVQRARRRVQRANEGLAALVIDRQIDQVQSDIQRTYLLEEEAIRDLEASRAPEIQEPGAGGKMVTVRRFVRGADGSIYRALVSILQQRARLRTEWLRLAWGKAAVAEAERRSSTMTEGWAELTNTPPEKSREVALNLYARELQFLERASALEGAPLPIELQRAEALRVRKSEARVRGLRSWLPLIEDGTHDSYELLLIEGETEENDGNGGEE